MSPPLLNSGQSVYDPAPGEAGAQADEHNIISGLQHVFFHQFIQSDGDRGSGGISILLNIIKDLFLRDLHTIPESFIYSQVGLVGNNHIQSFQLNTGFFQQFPG